MLFLAEAALGDEHSIVRDDPSLVSPPKGGPSDALKCAMGPCVTAVQSGSAYSCHAHANLQPADWHTPLRGDQI